MGWRMPVQCLEWEGDGHAGLLFDQMFYWRYEWIVSICMWFGEKVDVMRCCPSLGVSIYWWGLCDLVWLYPRNGVFCCSIGGLGGWAILNKHDSSFKWGDLGLMVDLVGLQVRANSLQDLVYQQGQSGIRTAVVSLTFDNSDKSRSPREYTHCDEINVTREVGMHPSVSWICGEGLKAETVVVDSSYYLWQLGTSTKVCCKENSLSTYLDSITVVAWVGQIYCAYKT